MGGKHRHRVTEETSWGRRESLPTPPRHARDQWIRRGAEGQKGTFWQLKVERRPRPAPGAVLSFPWRVSPPPLSGQDPGASDIAPAPGVDTEAGLARLGHGQHSRAHSRPKASQ